MIDRNNKRKATSAALNKSGREGYYPIYRLVGETSTCKGMFESKGLGIGKSKLGENRPVLDPSKVKVLKGMLRGVLPRPAQVPVQIRENLRVLLLSHSTNNLTRRVQNELLGYKASVKCLESRTSAEVEQAVHEHCPDLVVCPFLKARVPRDISRKYQPVLIVHPGIAGDRGASSLDWAILEQSKEWGVTVLEAAQELDAGGIWSTENFPCPNNTTKTALYNDEVSDSAVRCVIDAVSRFCQNLEPTYQEEVDELLGKTHRNMKHADRRVDWNMSAQEIATRVRMSDTAPGALGRITVGNNENPTEIRLFDAHIEHGENSSSISGLLRKGSPGELLARKQKSVLVKAGDNSGVWIGQMKPSDNTPVMKLPFTDGLPEFRHLPHISEPSACDDVIVKRNGSICYVYFDFYNGAMDKEQASRLQKTLEDIDREVDVKVVALMGGDRFFSTGIHLCAIENSHVKQLEAWANINAIDDVIKTLANMKNKATVAVLRGNAGAGGAMLAAACDVTVAHKGVLMTPSYSAMRLYGSEYWTYFFPQRVGHSLAQKLVRDPTPLSAEFAQSIGLLDKILANDKRGFSEELPEFLQQLTMDGKVTEIIRTKNAQRDSDWRHLLEKHRAYELSQMRINFRSQEFLTAMSKFVYKLV